MMDLDNCPCSGVNLPRFVQPVILAVLSSGPLHGYLVVQRLAETSLFRKQPLPDAEEYGAGGCAEVGLGT